MREDQDGVLEVDTLGDRSAEISAMFTRPADTTAYTSGDLVANNVTAASVVAMAFAAVARAVPGSGRVRRARLKKSGTGVTNASFRLHLYESDPTASVVNGDNAAWSTNHSGWLGALDISVATAFADGAAGQGAPNVGTDINFKLTGLATTLYGLVEARGAYTPASAEVFTATLEVVFD